MAPAARRKAGNGGSRQVAAAAADGDDDNAAKRRRQPSSATPSAATKTLTTPTPLTAAEAADACELEELGGIDPATSFLYTPHTLTGLVIGIALLIYYTGALSGYIPSSGYTGGGGGEVSAEDDPATGRRRGLVAALATWLLYCLLQGSPRMPLLRPHPAVWRLVHGAAVAYLLALVWLLCQTAEGARGALALLHPELGKPLPERSYEGDCGLLRRKAPAAAASGDGSSLSPPFSLFSSHELNLAALKSTLLDEFVVAHALGWWAKAILLRDRRLLWPLSVGFELAEAALAHALPNFRECWWDRWVLDVAVCNLVGMELGMATAALLRSRERGRGARERRSGGLLDAWGGVSTRRGALAKAGRVAAQFSPRSWEERDWDPRGSPRRAGWALFLVGAFLLFDLNSFFLKAALWVPQLNPLTLHRLCGFFLLGLPAFKEFYRFVVAGEQRAAEEERRKKLPNRGASSGLSPSIPASNRLGPCAWLMLAIIATETLVAVKFGPRLLAGGDGDGKESLPRSAKRAAGVFGVAAVGLAGSWLWSGLREERRRRRSRVDE